jgi:squalene-hopene/tetraprenyl-beta-curcumene cyclase
MAICATAVGEENASADAALDRGVGFLARDAMKWKAEHKCVSCHHAALVVWAMESAREQGRPVEEPVLAELTKWLTESGDGRTSVPRPEGRPNAFNSKALYFALGLAAVPNPDETIQSGMEKMITTVRSDQAQDGSWVAWPETRPPMFGPSDDTVTAMGTLAVMFAAENGDETARANVEKGLNWLSETPTDEDPQSVAMRVVVFRRAGRLKEIDPLLDLIRSRQNEDGGWSQATGMKSDAWATGQALYALSRAGVSADDPTVSRGRKFLASTQREDGSWEMASRPMKPGGTGAGNLMPIVGAGTAWAVIGLAESR